MTIRRAATVLCLRNAAASTIEVLLVRRHSRASFMANAHVFPGGAVDAADGDDSRVAARRELREEVGLDLPPSPPLLHFSRWLTPSAEPRRFDTDFFLAALPPGQSAVVDAREVFDPRWLTPAAALREAQTGALRLPPPTHTTLFELDQIIAALPPSGDAVAALLAACQGRPTPLITPKLVAEEETGTPLVVLPWDAAFSALPGEGDPLPSPAATVPPPRRFRITAEGFFPQR